MAVQDINIPGKPKVEDIRQIKPKSADDADYWEKQKIAKRARREALEEERMIEGLENPQMPEPPFQVKGSVNLGDFDIQAQQREAQEKAERERMEFKKQEQELLSRLQAAEKELSETKISQAMKEMGSQFSSLVKQLDDKISQVAKGRGEPESLLDYINEMEALASKMGYSKGGGGPQLADPNTTIQLEKMRIEEAARQRQFELEMKKFDFEMKRLMQKDNQEMELKKEELEQKKKRDGLLASAPELIGRAFAQGMMSESAEVSSSIKGKPSGETYEITANAGEAGELDCPGCGATIAIGPNANRAVCAKCKSSFNIKRENTEVFEDEDERRPK
jgi:ribosomal protein S27AE